MLRVLAFMFAALVASRPSLAAERLTDKCGMPPVLPEVVLVAQPALTAAIEAAVQNPASDDGLYDRLWRPTGVKRLLVPPVLSLALTYDEPQDGAQIADELRADPELAAKGLLNVQAGELGCFTLPAGPQPMQLTEYYNFLLDHYFLSSSGQENAIIDSGGAGAGWIRTGEIMTTIRADWCHSSFPVHRFYAPSSSSHVFTPDATECGIIRKPGSGWIYEGTGFGAYLPQNGECPPGKTGVLRLYNNRAAQGDSNHRFVTKLSLVPGMKQRGWVLEGVAFCVD